MTITTTIHARANRPRRSGCGANQVSTASGAKLHNAKPHMAIGSVEQIVEQLEVARERWGFSYLEVSSTDAEAVAPIMERLNGR